MFSPIPVQSNHTFSSRHGFELNTREIWQGTQFTTHYFPVMARVSSYAVEGYLAQKKQPPPLGPP